MSGELTIRLIAVVAIIAAAAPLSILAARALSAWYLWRHPELGQPLPPISAATEYDLLGRDNEMTQDINTGTYESGRPLYAGPAITTRAIESGRRS